MTIRWTLKCHDFPLYLPSLSLPVFPPVQFWKHGLILCALLLTTCSAPGYIDTVLFIVTEDKPHEQVTFEPVVQVQGGKLIAPQADEAFIKAYLQDRIYPLYRHGQLVGRVEATGVVPMGCSALQSGARLQVSVPLTDAAYSAQGLRYLLATSALLVDAPLNGPVLTNQERDLLVRTALERLKSLGLSQASLKRVQLTDAARINIAERPTLIGTMSALADSVSNPGATVFVILQQEGAAWKLVYSAPKRFTDIYGQDFAGQSFRDAVDLDRDGTPELILEQIGNEVYQYEILKRQDGEWRTIYTGGGGGC